MTRLVWRVAVGAVLILILVAAIGAGSLFLSGLVCLWCAAASWEYTGLMRRQGIALSRTLLPSINATLPIVIGLRLAFSGPMRPELGVFLLLEALVAIYVLFASSPRALKLVSAAFGVVYLGLLPCYLIWLRHYAYIEARSGLALVLCPLLATWLNDTVAYLLGSWLGRYRLAPDISPKKTWEGFLAGVIATMVFSGWYLPRLVSGASWLEGSLVGLVLGVSAQLGDLVESVFKRDASTKDSSSVFPGHGGFLDRADSLIFTVPVFYYYLTWRAPG